MYQWFEDQPNFNENISRWDTSSVTNMQAIFRRASAFNQDISGWNVHKVDSYRYFDDRSGFEGKTSLHPQLWGLCPLPTIQDSDRDGVIDSVDRKPNQPDTYFYDSDNDGNTDNIDLFPEDSSKNGITQCEPAHRRVLVVPLCD